MQLYNFFRSGSSHRLRIAMNLKGLAYDYVAVDLRTEEHLGAAFKALNPQGLVPVLVDGDLMLTQSPAIIEWLEERYPTPPLLPSGLEDRARVRAMAAIVGCDIHPISNAVPSASVTARRWPMPIWCRRWKARVVSRSI